MAVKKRLSKEGWKFARNTQFQRVQAGGYYYWKQVDIMGRLVVSSVETNHAHHELPFLPSSL